MAKDSKPVGKLFKYQEEMIARVEKMGKCALCLGPVLDSPGADVYHWTCLYNSLKEVRERCAKK